MERVTVLCPANDNDLLEVLENRLEAIAEVIHAKRSRAPSKRAFFKCAESWAMVQQALRLCEEILKHNSDPETQNCKAWLEDSLSRFAAAQVA